jgi:hypothetical protein
LRFEEYDSKLNQLQSFLESTDDSNALTRKYITDQIQETTKQKIKHMQEVRSRVEALFEDGRIDAEYQDELLNELEVSDKAFQTAYPWYEDALSAKAVSIIAKEAKALAPSVLSKVLAIVGVAAGYKILDAATKKYVIARLKKYPLVNPSAISPAQLNSETYTVGEAVSRFHIKFQYAEEWEKATVATRCIVYFYDKKPVMAIAYSRDEEKLDIHLNKRVAVETVVMDSRFRKHEDYYTAYMATRIQVSHPAIGRTLKKLKAQWDAEAKSATKEVKESVEELGLEKKESYITEAVEEEMLDEDDAKIYLNLLHKVSYR